MYTVSIDWCKAILIFYYEAVLHYCGANLPVSPCGANSQVVLANWFGMINGCGVMNWFGLSRLCYRVDM